MFEISKRDWKLFREKIGDWQEQYMEKLCGEYMKLLSGEAKASDKFWELEKRIKEDRKSPGVIIQLRKQDVLWDVIRLLDDKVITRADLDEFSKDFLDAVDFILTRRG